MTSASIARAPFGRLHDGTVIERVTLRGEHGFEASVLPFGATLQALLAPDRGGQCDDVVLGHDEFDGYLAQRKFFGATIGRYANRIAAARFVLDGETVKLDANNGPNALHGGPQGFDRKLWRVVELTDEPGPTLVLERESPHGEEGYPGNLQTRVTYRLRDPMELAVTYEATTDRPTYVNLTNHSFFNLDGARSGRQILDHRLTIASDHFLAVDATAIPLPGPPQPVDGTPFDFRKPTAIGARIRMNGEQLRLGRGYDHNFCLASGTGVRFAARLEAPHSGRVMELFTDQPGLQFYSGNFLDGSTAGKGDRLYRQSDALCLEPHAWPDTPNRPDFPSARLDPGQVYRRTAIYCFSTL
ncbi:aldose epimerase family protein [Bradyrhizobium sp. CCBAU 53421]|uniref:aldose epimerase family protein n=1 Tax=Bradyrhizobium sp. CCBAU 53421 TaxID=1325120 RepID=UPI00188D9B1A|nr:aldose epimerase family protein [Bradyrhizobium sp. CCBAU 53421]QOZ31921.1 galactose-1-epimerase [Bradyrhizobium sp. CCBAU 53421]